MASHVAILVFPGSNCDHDAYHAIKHVLGREAKFVWHKDTELGDADLVVVPGGFSYGDYLRSGAIARFSPIMQEVVRFAERGGLVMGICNGFQILCESGLLPGALMRNASLRFVCRDVRLRVETADTPFTSTMQRGRIVSIPVAHGDGNYYAAPDVISRLEDEDRVVFRYCDEHGALTADANPNGSTGNIAGILGSGRNVLGMMPHPERHTESILGCDDGRHLFESAFAWLEGTPA